MKISFWIGGGKKNIQLFSKFIKILILLTLLSGKSWAASTENQINIDSINQGGLRISTFDIDVTPPVGYPLAYVVENKKWDLGLRAKGIIIFGAGKPIVLCAIDAIGIGDAGNVEFKKVLA